MGQLGITETCERIKEEFNFIQNQYHRWVEVKLCSIDNSVGRIT